MNAKYYEEIYANDKAAGKMYASFRSKAAKFKVVAAGRTLWCFESLDAAKGLVYKRRGNLAAQGRFETLKIYDREGNVVYS